MTLKTPAAVSIAVFGAYMLLQGAALIFWPAELLSLLGLPLPQDAWVRVVGFSLGVLGYYYLQSARANHTAFFGWTVGVRLAQFGFFSLLVLSAQMRWPVLLTSALEAASGLWTLWALRRPSAVPGR